MTDNPTLDRKVKLLRYDGDNLQRVAWLLYGAGFAVEFHISIFEEQLFGAREKDIDGVGLVRCYAVGFETHGTRPPSYDEGKPPAHKNCTVVGGDCWHDGSSLAASEFFEWWCGDDEAVWSELRRWRAARQADYGPEDEAVTP